MTEQISNDIVLSQLFIIFIPYHAFKFISEDIFQQRLVKI